MFAKLTCDVSYAASATGETSDQGAQGERAMLMNAVS